MRVHLPRRLTWFTLRTALQTVTMAVLMALIATVAPAMLEPEGSSAGAAAALQLPEKLDMPAKVYDAPRASTSGEVEFDWHRVDDADSYRVSWTVNGAPQPEIPRESYQLSAVVQASAHRGKTVCAKVVAKSDNRRLFTDSYATNLGCVAVPTRTARPTVTPRPRVPADTASFG